MEKEAILRELVMLENQLTSSETQINGVTEDLDKQRNKVIPNHVLIHIYEVFKEWLSSIALMQVCSIKQEYDEAESQLNASRSKLKECDKQINGIAKEQQKLHQKLSDAAVERKRLDNEVFNLTSCVYIVICTCGSMIVIVFYLNLGETLGDRTERLLFES